jgi:hypothetical protein
MFVSGINAYIESYLPWFIAFPLSVIIVLVSIYWTYNKADIEERLKPHKTTVNGFLIAGLIFSGIFVVFGVGFYVGSYGEKLEIVQKNSLQVAYNDDFEDIKDSTYVGPWAAYPKKNHTLDPSDKYAHSGTHSLKLTVKNQPYEKDMGKEYGGIGITDLNIHKAKTIEAWVLVPESDQARGSIIKSHIIAYMKDSSDESIGFFGEEEEIEPGIWTPIFLGLFYETDCENCTFKWDGTIHGLYLTVWSDQSYWGSIYFDDITICK